MKKFTKKRYIINNLKEKDKHKGVTVVTTFSRVPLVPIFFKSFNKMSLPRKEMHLIVYDNTQNLPLAKALLFEVEKIKSKFLSVRLYKSWRTPKGCLRGVNNEVFNKSKLANIWEMWITLFKRRGGMVFTKEFFMLEDDTIAQPDSFPKLIKTLRKHAGTGFVTGIETGRWENPFSAVRLGVHQVKMRGLKVITRHSLSPFCRGIKSINASGVYCFAAKTKAFQSGFKGYDPLDVKVPFFAMDNVLIYNITRHGWSCYADFSVWCSHLHLAGNRLVAWSKDQAVETADIWIPEFNNYAQNIIVKGKNYKPRFSQQRKPAQYWEI